MVDTLRVVVAGAVVLGIMVLLHEWGHFVAAKLCGVRVDVFSIGFGPRVWGVKRGDTDYRVSVLPLGGYVRMAGDNPMEERTGAPYEFLSRHRRPGDELVSHLRDFLGNLLIRGRAG